MGEVEASKLLTFLVSGKSTVVSSFQDLFFDCVT